MATVGMQLLSHVIRTGKLTEVLDWGIAKEDFLGAEERAMLDMLLAYKTTYGAVFGPALLAEKFPTFELCDDGAQITTQALCAEVRKSRLRIEAKKQAEILAEAADYDPLAALMAAQATMTGLIHLGMSAKTDVHFADAIEEIVDDYEMMEAGLYKPRMLYPWPLMNEMTCGIQEDDYIVFYGRPKSMKSWVLSYMIGTAFEHGKKILIYTKEMTPKNIYKRIAACIAQLPYQELRMAKLSPQQKQELMWLRQHIAELRVAQTFICLSAKDVAPGGDTTSWLRAKVEKYKPVCCFIDGLYLMSPEGGRKNMQTNERVENISRGTRQMILDTGTPVIATMQANRKAAQHQQAELDEVAFSDAISQDATIIARVINEKHTHPKYGETIAIVLGGSREFKLHGFRIGGRPAQDFTFKEIMTEKDIDKAKTQDTKLDEPDGDKEHATKRTPSNKSANGAASYTDRAISDQFKSL